MLVVWDWGVGIGSVTVILVIGSLCGLPCETQCLLSEPLCNNLSRHTSEAKILALLTIPSGIKYR
jgi:hypothetical protein